MDSWRQNTLKRMVLDNGSHEVRFGNASSKTRQLNIIAQVRKSGALVYDLDGLFDESHVMRYLKPHVKGVLVDFDKQIAIWDRILPRSLKDCSITFPYQFGTPDPSMNRLLETFFEYYQCDGFCPVVAQKVIGNGQFKYIIDSSHSGTYFVPIFDGEVISAGVRRMDVGGRLLANHLKEIISFRQFDFKNYYLLSMQIKESLCFVSQDFKSQMKQPKKSILKYYVLPDFEIKKEGYATDNLNIGFQEAKIALDKERISIPELLFNPADIGIHQTGPIETIKDSLSSIDPDLRGYFMENVYLTGGNTLFANYASRMTQTIREVFPIEWQTQVTHMSNRDAVFDGCLTLNTTEIFQQSCFSRQEYAEKGFDNLKNYF